MGNTFIMLAMPVAMLISTAITLVRAESHTIRFNNQCGTGTPKLVIGGYVLSNGEDWTSNGPAQSGIAYLQTGPCLLNGEHCAIVEFNLNNPACPGCGSYVDLSLIPPHALNVPTAFSFFNGCDGSGASCATSGCGTAYHNPNDNQVIVACQVDNVDLLITFCPSGGNVSSSSSQQVPSSSNAAPSAVPSPASTSPSSTSSLASTTSSTQVSPSATQQTSSSTTVTVNEIASPTPASPSRTSSSTSSTPSTSSSTSSSPSIEVSPTLTDQLPGSSSTVEPCSTPPPAPPPAPPAPPPAPSSSSSHHHHHQQQHNHHHHHHHHHPSSSSSLTSSVVPAPSHSTGVHVTASAAKASGNGGKRKRGHPMPARAAGRPGVRDNSLRIH